MSFSASPQPSSNSSTPPQVTTISSNSSAPPVAMTTMSSNSSTPPQVTTISSSSSAPPVAMTTMSSNSSTPVPTARQVTTTTPQVTSTSHIRNKYFITTCIAGLILFGAAEIHTTIRNIPSLWHQISLVNMTSARQYLKVTFFLTIAYDALFLAWLVTGVIYEMDLAKIDNTTDTTAETKKETQNTSELHSIFQTLSKTIVYASIIMIVYVVIGYTIVFFKIGSLQSTTGSLNQHLQLYSQTIPNFLLLILISFLPTKYMDIIDDC